MIALLKSDRFGMEIKNLKIIEEDINYKVKIRPFRYGNFSLIQKQIANLFKVKIRPFRYGNNNFISPYFL